MRVGILTFHHAFNYGAFLQAEGLLGCLCNLGHKAEIVDYRNPALEATHERCIRYGWHPLHKLAGYRRRARFIDDLKDLKPGPLAHDPVSIDWSRYDALVYGSDEIWNYLSHVHRFDPVFFGGGAPASMKRIAYAPSLGELDWPQRQVPAEIPDLLSAYQDIAVRDTNAAQFVEKTTGHVPPIVVDPVFLHHRSELQTPRETRTPFVLVYGEIRDRAMAQACRDWSKRLGCNTVSVGYRNPWCDRMVLDAGPHDFLGWLAEARAVLTTTFHGTMFSIKFQKPFVTLRPPTARKKFDPIIQQLELGERIVATSDELTTLAPEIVWDQPGKILAQRTDESIGFLRNALSS
ncbi:MAG: polysaccharide pyruvyl transferase family protein [Luteolibacter sp.]